MNGACIIVSASMRPMLRRFALLAVHLLLRLWDGPRPVIAVWDPKDDFSSADRAALARVGGSLVTIPAPAGPLFDAEMSGPLSGLEQAAYAVDQWLRTCNFSRVVSVGMTGALFYAMLAKSQGLAYATTSFELVAIGSNEEIDRAWLHHPGLEDLALYFMERETDRLCGRRLVIAGSPPIEDDRPSGTDAAATILILLADGGQSEASFVASAISRMAPVSVQPSFVVWSPGGEVADEITSPISDAVAKRGWVFRAATDPDWRLGVPDGIDPERCLAIVNSSAAIEPLMHALTSAWGVKVLSTTSATSPASDGGAHLVRPAPSAVAAAFDDFLAGRGLPTSASPEGYAPPSAPPVISGETGAPLVSVCVSHFNRPELLSATLQSLSRQTWANLEVVVVDDGSTRADALAYLAAIEQTPPVPVLRVVRQTNRYLGAARNRAASEARGDYLLFMDDDNLAKPEMVERFVRAATASDADVLTSFCDVFESTRPDGEPVRIRRRLFLGPAVGPAVFTNCFGDANALIRREFFNRLGGFTEDYGVGHEDWEFFMRAATAGARFSVVPEALFDYRVADGSMIATTRVERNHFRSIRPLLDDAAGTGAALALAQSLYLQLWSPKTTDVEDAARPLFENDIIGLKAEILHLRRELAAVRASSFWRVGEKLRRFETKFRRGLRGLLRRDFS